MEKIKFAFSLCFLSCLLFLASCKHVETKQPLRKDIQEAVFASGFIEQEHEYSLAANVAGILLSFPHKEGDPVGKNERIATIESEVQSSQLQDALAVYKDAKYNASPDAPQLEQIQTQINQAEEQLKLDEENYGRYKELWEKKSVSRLDLERTELQYQASQNNLLNLEKNYQEVRDRLNLNEERSHEQVLTQKAMLKDYTLFASASGHLIKVLKKQGELVRRGETIAKIGSGDYVIKLFVSEEDITKINTGQHVAVNINTYPTETFSARISKIYPAFDEGEQSYTVEARFEQMPQKMFSGTQLQANIQTDLRKDVLLIPSTYLSKGRFVVLETGEEKQIEIGRKNGDWTEVISGITDQDVLRNPQN